jgi:hypothetical protein
MHSFPGSSATLLVVFTLTCVEEVGSSQAWYVIVAVTLLNLVLVRALCCLAVICAVVVLHFSLWIRARYQRVKQR